MYRRNRKHLRPSTGAANELANSSDIHNGQTDDTNIENDVVITTPGTPHMIQSPARYMTLPPASPTASSPPYQTRRGRVVKPPERLNLKCVKLAKVTTDVGGSLPGDLSILLYVHCNKK